MLTLPRVHLLLTTLLLAIPARAQLDLLRGDRLVTPASERLIRPVPEIARACGLNAVQYTTILRASPRHVPTATWVETCLALRKAGFTPAPILLRQPAVDEIGNSFPTAQADLRSFGFADPVAAAVDDPELLRLAPKAMTTLRQNDLVEIAGWVSGRAGRLRLLDDGAIDHVSTSLRSLGLPDSTALVRANPSILEMTKSEFLLRQKQLEHLGFATPWSAIEKEPAFLTLRIEVLRLILQRLKPFGFKNPGHLLERAPEFLGYIRDGTLTSRLEYLLSTRKFTIEAIEADPLVLGRPPVSNAFAGKPRRLLLEAGFTEDFATASLAGNPKLLKMLSKRMLARAFGRLRSLGLKKPLDRISDEPRLLTEFNLTDARANLTFYRRFGFSNLEKLIEAEPRLLLGEGRHLLTSRINLLAYQGFLNPVALINGVPKLLNTTEERLREMVRVLLDTGLRDIIGFVDQAPLTLAYVLDGSLTTRLEHLRSLGLKDPVDAVQRFPWLLDYPYQTLGPAKVKHLRLDWQTEHGTESACNNPHGGGPPASFQRIRELYEALEHGRVNPKLLSPDVKRLFISHYDQGDLHHPIGRLYVRGRWYTRPLERLGFKDAKGLIARAPEVLELSTLQILARAQLLTRLGVSDPYDVLERVPVLLTLSADKISARFDALRDVGFVAPADMVRRMPELLNYALQSRIGWVLDELTKDWSFDLAEIEDRPFLLKYSKARVADVRAYLTEMGVDVPSLPAQMRVLLVRKLSREKIIATLESNGYHTDDERRAGLAQHLNGAGLFMKYFMCERTLAARGPCTEGSCDTR